MGNSVEFRFPSNATVSEVGEKRIIEQVLRPLFNPRRERNSVGDDCAALEIPLDSLVLASTDRVPVDLISFRTGILTYEQFGRYLAVLNLSDIAACGGSAVALLLNCGLPGDILVSDLLLLSLGFKRMAEQYEAKVVGGDVTSSSELSLSATVIGHVAKDGMLRRSGAKVGDSIFVSRQIGLTPLGLDYCLHRDRYGWMSADDRARLEAQFTHIDPEINLGRKLSLSGCCTSCMDNTDGVGQSLQELARESVSAFLIYAGKLALPNCVLEAAGRQRQDATLLALGPGADFALVGTLAGEWTDKRAKEFFGPEIQIIGTVIAGEGVFLETRGSIGPLYAPGWNYFSSSWKVSGPSD
jgi:thiamine-monophosphate kinase